MPRRGESRAHGSRRSPAGRGPLCFSPETSAVGGCDALRWASPNVLHTASQTIHSFEYPYDVGVAPMTCEYVHLAAGLARGGGAKQLTLDGSVYWPHLSEGDVLCHN